MQIRTLDRYRCVGGAALMLGLTLVLGGFAGPSFAEEAGDPAFLGVQLGEETERPEGGARVTRVVDGSPATEAGIREGDIVVEFEGAVIRDPQALTQRIHARRPGDTVTLTVIRDGVDQILEVELGRRSDRTRYSVGVPPSVMVVPEYRLVEPLPTLDADEFPELDPEDLLEGLELKGLSQFKTYMEPLTWWSHKPSLGVQLVETTPELREHLGGTEEAGVLVSKILSGMPAQKAGLLVGDLIVSVDGEPVASSNELILALRDKAGETFDVEIVRNRRPRTLEVTIPVPETDRPTGPRA